MDVKITPSRLEGTVRAVSSKSDAHRILIAAALSDKKTVIHCNSDSEDIKATVGCLEALGAEITRDGDIITVIPVKDGEKDVELDCRESGSTLRFLLPVAAALGKNAVLTGSGRLPSRPILPLRNEMEKNGVTFTPPWQFPIGISGKLQSGEYTLKGNVSSQFVTGLLFALALLDGDSTIRLLPPVESRSYINMTVNTLSKFGVCVTEKDNTYYIKGSQKYTSPEEIFVEGDWSNAAFFLCAGAINGDVTVTGLDRNSLQGDKKIVDILRQMGADAEVGDDKIRVKSSELHGVQIDASDIPDLVPVLSVTAANAKSGVTVVTNAERLRLKESDRLRAICESLTGLGNVNAQTDDGLVIWCDEKLTGGEVSSYSDHRMVMSAAVAALGSEREVTVRGAEAVNKSYPNFFEDYKMLGGKADVINPQG